MDGAQRLEDLFLLGGLRTGPERAAVCVALADGAPMTFAELHGAAVDVAAAMDGLGAAPLGVCCEGSCAMAVAVLAALYRLCPFVPVASCTARTLALVGAQAVLVHESHALAEAQAAAARSVGPPALGLRLVPLPLAKDRPAIGFPPEPCSTVAYVLSTSGSTGEAKAVAVPHAAIVDNIRGLLAAGVRPGQTAVVMSPLTFDPSIVDLFLAFVVGACAVLLPPRLRQQPLQLFAALERHRVDYMCACPSAILRFGNEHLRALAAPTSSLRTLMLGGEAFPPPSQVLAWWPAGSPLRIFNVYGTTEVSCWALLREVDREALAQGQGPDLGAPLCGVEVDTVDAGAGERELRLGGQFRGCLVWDPKLGRSTQEAMSRTGDLVAEEHGRFTFLRRREATRCKRDGQWVCLSHLERVCGGSLGVPCAFVADTSKTRPLLALFLAAPEAAIQRLAAQVRGLPLGPAGQPDRILGTRDLPVTANGKLDRALLLQDARLADQPGEREKGWGPEEAHLSSGLLLRVLASVGLQGVELQRSFLEQGGDSQLALLVAQQLLLLATGSGDLGHLLDALLAAPTLEEALGRMASPPAKLRHLPPSLLPSSSPPSSLSAPLLPLQSELSPAPPWCHVCTRGRVLPGSVCAHQADWLRPVRPHVMRKAWKQELGKCVDASPLVVTSASGRAMSFIGSHSHLVEAFDVDSGSRVWQVLLPDRVEGSAALSACGRFVLVPCYDGGLYVLHVDTGAEHWCCRAAGAEIKCQATVDHTGTGHVFFGSHDGAVRCVNVGARELVWAWDTTAVHGQPTAVFASVVLEVGRRLAIACTLSGHVVALDMATGALVWAHALGQPVFSTPLILGDAALLCCASVDGVVRALALGRQPEVVWTHRAAGPVFSSLAAHGDRLYFGDHSGAVTCLHAATGRAMWCTALGGQVYATPFPMGNGAVVCAATTGLVAVLCGQTGTHLSELQLPGQVYSSPVAATPTRLLVGCRDDYIYALDLVDP